MVCLNSGFATVSINTNKDCCKGDPTQSVLKATCCDFLNFNINLKEYNFVQKKDIPNAAILSVALCNYSFIQPQHTSIFVFNTINQQPTSLYGKGLLSFISTWVI